MPLLYSMCMWKLVFCFKVVVSLWSRESEDPWLDSLLYLKLLFERRAGVSALSVVLKLVVSAAWGQLPCYWNDAHLTPQCHSGPGEHWSAVSGFFLLNSIQLGCHYTTTKHRKALLLRCNMHRKTHSRKVWDRRHCLSAKTIHTAKLEARQGTKCKWTVY